MRGFTSKLLGADGRPDPRKLKSMPAWFQGRLAYLDLLKKREAIDRSDKPDLDVTMDATSACEKIGGSTGIFGLAQQYVGKAVPRLKKLGLNYAFYYKRPHEKDGEVKGAKAIELLEMLRGEGTGRAPMMIGANNRTGFALLYEMLTGQVRLSVGKHPLGDSNKEELETKKDDEQDSSTKKAEKTMLDKAMLDMCEQLEPLMPQYERKDLLLLLKKFGNVEAVVNVFLQGESVVNEILKTLRKGPTTAVVVDRVVKSSPYEEDARKLHNLFPQYTLEEIEAMLEINSGNVQKTGNDLASLPLFSVRGMARKRIKEKKEQSEAIDGVAKLEGPRATSAPSWETAKLMLQIMILNALKRNRGRIPETDILILPVLITFVKAMDCKWKEASLFPQFPFLANASRLSDGLKTQECPSLNAFVKMAVDATNVIVSSNNWKPMEKLIQTKPGASGKLVLTRGYDSGHFRGMSDCDCEKRLFSGEGEEEAFSNRPLMKLSQHVMIEEAQMISSPRLGVARSSRHNVEAC